MFLKPAWGPVALLLTVSVTLAQAGTASEHQSTLALRHDTPDALSRLADEYWQLDRADEDKGVLPIRNQASSQRRNREQDQILVRLKLIHPADLSKDTQQTEYAILLRSLESQRALRICHAERWDLNHITGWQVRLPQQAASQATASAADREQALRRWESLSAYIASDISNLKTGLASGYSVPKSVAMRVLRQTDALAATILSSDGPFDGPASRAGDLEFQARWRAMVAEQIAPSIRRFAAFLRDEYLPHARAGIGVWELPDGGRCYAALLSRETTLDVSADATYELGQATVERTTTQLKILGAKLFGTSEVKEILKRAQAEPANHFDSPDAIVSYANRTLARSIQMSAPYFLEMPRQPIEIEPLPSYQQGSGISSHYEASGNLSQAAVYRINLDRWQEQTRGAITVTAVHEGVPGHHLQRETARSSPLAKSIAELAYNSAYVEGWANYVELLCEEIGVYDTPYSAIFRRMVLGQSLIIDPSIHVKRWDRDQARAYLSALDQSDSEADELIDRIAVQPAQLTSYEYGGLEILRLRERARDAFGTRFDIREVHRRILANGPVPLMTLRAAIETWALSASEKMKER